MEQELYLLLTAWPRMPNRWADLLFWVTTTVLTRCSWGTRGRGAGSVVPTLLWKRIKDHCPSVQEIPVPALVPEKVIMMDSRRNLASSLFLSHGALKDSPGSHSTSLPVTMDVRSILSSLWKNNGLLLQMLIRASSYTALPRAASHHGCRVPLFAWYFGLCWGVVSSSTATGKALQCCVASSAQQQRWCSCRHVQFVPSSSSKAAALFLSDAPVSAQLSLVWTSNM